MKKREEVLTKLMELELDFPAQHHYYFTGKSIPLLEAYGIGLIEKIEKETKMAFKGIVKHFSIVIPYFDGSIGVEKFLCELKESVSIAKDCYDEYSGIILIEFDNEWSIHGLNESIIKVLEYLKSLKQVRFVVLFPYASKKEIDLYTALSSVGVWAFVEIGDVDFRAYMEECNRILNEEGFKISDQMQEEICQLLDKRQNEIVDVELILAQWIKQVSLNRRLSENDCKDITMEDIRLLSGVNRKKGNYTIGFGLGR